MAVNTEIYSNVYNYFQADLRPKTSSGRFDSHKTKDLKDVYRSIIKLSKDEPVFLIDRSKAVERYTIHMKESALQFRTSVAELGGLDDATIFNQKTVYSSDPEKATVEYSAKYQYSDKSERTEEDYRISINQLATGQENFGTFLPQGASGLPEGDYSFDVGTASSNYELQFSVSPTDSNRDIQNRLVRLVNNFNLGLSARIEEDGEGNSALVLRSNAVGDRPSGRFSISDEETSMQSGVVDYLGIRTPTMKASDAFFSVNGAERRSTSNDISLDGIYDVKLRQTTEEGEDIVIGVKPDLESMKDNIISLAGSYNTFLKAAMEYLDQQPRTSLLVKYLQTNSAFYTAGLKRLGVVQGEDGLIEVDEEKLSNTLRNEDTDGELDILRGFTRFALRKAGQVQLNPMDYVDKRIVAYKDPTKPHYANPYITSAYSGMLFNGYMR